MGYHHQVVTLAAQPTLPQAGIQRRWTALPGEAFSDGGDPYTAYDRFSCTEPRPDNLSAFPWDLLFDVEFEELETGWMNCGYRFYVSVLGRWVGRDPIGEVGGVYMMRGFRGTPPNIRYLSGLSDRDWICCTEPGLKVTYRGLGYWIGRYPNVKPMSGGFR